MTGHRSTGSRSAPRAVAGAVALASLLFVVACTAGDEDAGADVDSEVRDTVESADAASVGDVDVLLGAGEVVAELDERFQSYNVEMVEVTGGEFWKPYDAGSGRVTRPPLDLSNERLRNLATALGPAYIRVSGSWANSTYFDADGTTGGVVPEGYRGVLTPEQWLGVGDFADAVDGKIVTSFASNDEVRDESGAWLPDQARSLLEFSTQHDVPVVAAELVNEPAFPVGVPAGYGAQELARDVATFTELVKEVRPDLLVVGPGSAGEETSIIIEPAFGSDEVIEATGPVFDVFSYHFYPKVSERCGSTDTPDIALTEEYLTRVERDAAHYRAIHDRLLPETPTWVTETAQAACGGDRWAATFRDVPRYVRTLGALAGGDGDVVFHNTLAASDYALIDEDGNEPRPNYWAAVLWARLMGPTVLAVDENGEGSDIVDLAVFAHCTPDGSPSTGVAYAVVNSSTTETRTVATASGRAEVFLLTGDLDGTAAELNGEALTAAEDGTVPDLAGASVTGRIEVPPAAVAFVVDESGADACS